MEPGNGKHRLLAEHLPDAFAYYQIVTDDSVNPVDYIFIDMNPAFEEMFNLPKDRTIGKKITEVFPDINESSVDWIGTFGKVALTGENLRFEHYYKPLDRWYEITACSDEHGFFAVFSRDITMNKQAEEALKFFQEYLESSTDAIGMSTSQGHHYYQNKAFTELFGNVGENLPDTMYVNKKIGEEIFRTIMSGKDWIGEVKMYAKDGQVLDILLRAYANKDDTGKIAGLVGIHTNITDYKQTEEALRTSEERYRLLVENISVAIVVAQDKMHKYVNSMALQLFGCSEEVLLALPISQFIHPEERDIVIDRHSKRLRAQPVTAGYIHRIISGDGQTKWVESNNVLIQWEGRPASLTFLMDITERKQAEQKLADYTLELEKLYHQLDAELDKARQVHERTLPTALPAVEGISFAAHYQPAKKMGGDFYDVLQSGNKLIFYLSDVSGHGLDGAMLSVFIKHTVSSYISFTPAESISPARVLGYLAKRFRQENYPDELYFCIFMAVLDLETLDLSYCGAGFQEEMLLRMGSGEKMKLAAKGLFITSYLPTEMLKLHDISVAITPGTTLFCNTDGLTEEGNKGSYYREKLPDVFFHNTHLSPQLVAHAVVEDFRNFTGGSLQGKDDVSFLVLQLDPPEMETYHFQLASNFGELKRLREDALTLLIGIEDVYAFAASLYELAANAIEHGNRFDHEKVVSVAITVTGGYFQAVVQDQGKGFNWREKIDSPMELKGNQERGRGIAMTRICAERLFYNKQGNQATLLVKRNKGSSSIS